MSGDAHDEEFTLETAHAQVREISSVLGSEGWAILRKLVNAQVNQRLGTIILQPATDNGFGKEYASGEMAGMELVMGLLGSVRDTLVDNIEAAEANIASEAKQENDNDSPSGTDGASP